jgi:hypothetical protein
MRKRPPNPGLYLRLLLPLTPNPGPYLRLHLQLNLNLRRRRPLSRP